MKVMSSTPTSLAQNGESALEHRQHDEWIDAVRQRTSERAGMMNPEGWTSQPVLSRVPGRDVDETEIDNANTGQKRERREAI
mmetsp:Transcript_100281/g.288086  ORF Transcript_100281/g.288086 Transcript_100281/m.288086 type:complete len:82 (+) Transcript_100281:621-866(+)